MSSRFQRLTGSCDRPSLMPPGFAHRSPPDDDPDALWDDDEPDPSRDEFWDLDALDDDEPQPEPGDFWPQFDDGE